MHTKRCNYFFKRWVQFRMGAIPQLPKYMTSNYGTPRFNVYIILSEFFLKLLFMNRF